MKKIIIMLLLVLPCVVAKAQYSYGTTGLLNMPTADMQKDRTLMIGGGYLDKHTSTARWFYNTYNYYVNITFFPWFEFTYNMELHKALANDRGNTSYWVPSTYGKFVNQDRQFGVRFRLWKEGWWKDWTPQIVFGWDDVSSNSWGETDRRFEIADNAANNFNFRMYLAATKHFEWYGIGRLGGHIAYVYNKRSDYPLNGIAVGANFKLKLADGGDGLCGQEYAENKFQQVLNGLNVMAEFYPAGGNGYNWSPQFGSGIFDRGLHFGKYDVNIGATYSIWEDRINLIGELYGCKDFSGGIQFKIHL